MENKYFLYDESLLEHFKDKDEILYCYMKERGFIERLVTPDIFESIVNTIVSQLISTKAADAIYLKIKNLLGEVTPENVDKVDWDELRACGLTKAKTNSIKEIAARILDGRLQLEEFSNMTDEEITKELIQVKGIGNWTAEMILIFTLGRMDVVSYKDLGIRRGMMKLYNLSELDEKTFMEYRKNYSPYGAVVSLYLWDIS